LKGEKKNHVLFTTDTKKTLWLWVQYILTLEFFHLSSSNWIYWI